MCKAYLSPEGAPHLRGGAKGTKALLGWRDSRETELDRRASRKHLHSSTYSTQGRDSRETELAAKGEEGTGGGAESARVRSCAEGCGGARRTCPVASFLLGIVSEAMALAIFYQKNGRACINNSSWTLPAWTPEGQKTRIEERLVRRCGCLCTQSCLIMQALPVLDFPLFLRRFPPKALPRGPGFKLCCSSADS